MKYALVTGGSRGIGQAVCLKLAEMGYHILINYQSNDTEAEATLQQIREQGSDGDIIRIQSFRNDIAVNPKIGEQCRYTP